MLSFLNCTRTKSFDVTETTSFNMKYAGFCDAQDEREGLETLVAELMAENGKSKRGKKCHITVSPKVVQLSFEKEPSKELYVEYICYGGIDSKNTNMFVMNYVVALKPVKQFQCHVFLGKSPHDVERLARLTAKYHQDASEELKKELRKEEERRQIDRQVQELEKKMDETEPSRKRRDENQNSDPNIDSQK